MEESGASPGGDLLGPLKASLNRIVKLAQLVKRFELEPSKIKLKGISKELANSKAKVQTLAQPLMLDDPAIAGKAHELAQEVNEVTSRGQKRIHKLLR
jgi:hypothetical protein